MCKYLFQLLLFFASSFFSPVRGQETAPSNAVRAETYYLEPETLGDAGDGFYQELLQMIWTLGLVLLVLLTLMWIVKRFFNAKIEQINASSVFRVIEKRPLSTKTSLYMIETLGKRIVFAETQNGVTRLTESPSASFEEILEPK